MSTKYDMLATRWQKGYITEGTLRGWVTLNEKKPGAGITPEEFKQITGRDY